MCPASIFVLADLSDAGLKAAGVPYLEARWKKAVWNMPFNGMTVALNTSTDKLLNTPATRQLIYDQMIATTDRMVPYSPSMKLDFDNGRPMEIEYLYTRPIAEARKAGFDMPKLAMLEAELRFIESRLTSAQTL